MNDDPRFCPARHVVMGSDYREYQNPYEFPQALPEGVTVLYDKGLTTLPAAIELEMEAVVNQAMYEIQQEKRQQGKADGS